MDDTIRNCLILIPALPLGAAVVVALLGPRVLRGYSHWPVVLALGASFLASLVLAREAIQDPRRIDGGGFEQVVALWNWVNVADAYELQPNPPAVQATDAGWRDFRVDITLRADALTAIMLAM